MTPLLGLHIFFSGNDDAQLGIQLNPFIGKGKSIDSDANKSVVSHHPTLLPA
jgi:hypothetical protein